MYSDGNLLTIFEYVLNISKIYFEYIQNTFQIHLIKSEVLEIHRQYVLGPLNTF